jgi:hypothetical protein
MSNALPVLDYPVEKFYPLQYETERGLKVDKDQN